MEDTNKANAEKLVGGECSRLREGNILREGDVYSNGSQCHRTDWAGVKVGRLTAHRYFRENK